METVFLVKHHTWDYDFHDNVVAVYADRDKAIARIANEGPYDVKTDRGWVIEEWPVDGKFGSIVYPPECVPTEDGSAAD